MFEISGSTAVSCMRYTAKVEVGVEERLYLALLNAVVV